MQTRTPGTTLADFLWARRTRLRPEVAGLPEGERRRTPGLRRQEVAQLAGISVDYYVRMEQGRGPAPSRQVLTALSRALSLSDDERDYLFRVAGQSPPEVSSVVRQVSPTIRMLLDGLTAVPAYVVDVKYDLLAWNRLALPFIQPAAERPEGERNLMRWMFGSSDTDPRWDAVTQGFARAAVADLRASYPQHADDPGMDALITDLLGTSERFAALWAEHEVDVQRRVTKRFDSQSLGPVEFDSQVLDIPGTGQRLITYCARPASPTRDLFRDLDESAFSISVD